MRSKGRSQRYPKYALQDCLRMAECINRLGPAGVSNRSLVTAALGHTDDRGGFKRKLASLIQFGLVAKTRRGGDLRLTELAMRCLSTYGTERGDLMRDCLRNPEAFRSIIADLGFDTSKQSQISAYLCKSQHFTAKGADSCAASFVESVRLVEAYGADELTKEAARVGAPRLTHHHDEAPLQPPMQFIATTVDTLRNLAPHEREEFRRILFGESA